ncbi:TSUP family transporter [Salinisphaera aquimarina]|uniref:Probable membrane transporter protein n=1 Tax=Salinisphaera aquimarina TaxID=2094031 RepID=A0ABV7EUH2_9GAMM
MPDASPITLAVVGALLLIYLFGGFIKGAAAFGQPMMTIPLSSFFLPVPTAIAISIAPVMIANVVQLVQNRRAIGSTLVYWPFYLTLSISMMAGLVVFSNAGHAQLLTFIGVLIMVFVVVQLSGWQPRIVTPLRLRVQLVCGVVSGLLGGITSFASFPSIPVFVACRMERHVFSMVVGVMFLLVSTILSTGLSMLGIYGKAEIAVMLACILPSVAGQMIGQRMRDRLPEERLRLVVFSMLGAMGVSLVLRGLL